MPLNPTRWTSKISLHWNEEGWKRVCERGIGPLFWFSPSVLLWRLPISSDLKLYLFFSFPLCAPDLCLVSRPLHSPVQTSLIVSSLIFSPPVVAPTLSDFLSLVFFFSIAAPAQRDHQSEVLKTSWNVAGGHRTRTQTVCVSLCVNVLRKSVWVCVLVQKGA